MTWGAPDRECPHRINPASKCHPLKHEFVALAAVASGLLDIAMQVMNEPFTLGVIAARMEGMMASQLDGSAAPPGGILTV